MGLWIALLDRANYWGHPSISLLLATFLLSKVFLYAPRHPFGKWSHGICALLGGANHEWARLGDIWLRWHLISRSSYSQSKHLLPAHKQYEHYHYTTLNLQHLLLRKEKARSHSLTVCSIHVPFQLLHNRLSTDNFLCRQGPTNGIP